MGRRETPPPATGSDEVRDGSSGERRGGAGWGCGRPRPRRRSGGCPERADRAGGGSVAVIGGVAVEQLAHRRGGRGIGMVGGQRAARAAQARGTRRRDSRRSAARRPRPAAVDALEQRSRPGRRSSSGAGPRSSGSAPASSRSSWPPATDAICSAFSPAASAARSTTAAAATVRP